MKRVLDYIREDIYEKKGLFNLDIKYSELVKTEINPMFEKLCRSRMIMGAYRYGALHSKDKTVYNYLKDGIKVRVDLYEKTGNMDYLVDIANYCMLEFTYPSHLRAHLKVVEDVKHINEF